MKRWHVLQVYAGYEQAVQDDLFRRIEDKGLQELFGEVLVPSAKMKQIFDTGDSQDQQLFPGYVLVEMEETPETMSLVTASSRVLRMLGAVSKKEIDRILSQMKGEIKVATEKQEFSVGGEIEIKDGPFAGFVGIIEQVDSVNEKLTVMVSIFGRMTPVDLGFDQIIR